MRLVFLFLIFLPNLVAAQSQRQSHCIALADADPALTYVHKAVFRDPVDPFGVRISYIDHSMFLIQTPGGANAVTDYNGFIGLVDFVPDVVTMNNAHSSHWTTLVDPAIPHVLRGWPEGDQAAQHRLTIKDMLVRNVTTDTRSRFETLPVRDGNSIFVFEAEGLCIGHMGHLHHEPDVNQYAALGRLDVVMVPVDGGFTMDRPSLIAMLTRLRSSLVVPMHWFSETNLNSFLAEMSETYAIDRRDDATLTISLRDLPPRPTIVVLRPQFLRDAE